MKWRLKDRALEKKLNELSDGEFSENLCKQNSGHFISCFGDHLCFAIQNECVNKAFWQYRFAVFFSADEVEEVPEYKPDDWNEFPTVDPPLDVLMRVELSNGMKYGAIFKRFGNEYSWCYSDGRPMYESFTESVTRFRPWED